jgi:hypothetical protein
MAPLSFSDVEMDRVRSAAAMLPNERRRGDFLKLISNRLGSLPYNPQPADIENAIVYALGELGVAVGRGTFGFRPSPKRPQSPRSSLRAARG